MQGMRENRMCTAVPAAAGTATGNGNARREDMPMCRHVHNIHTEGICCVVEQLREMNLILDYQNRILVELLQAVRGERDDKAEGSHM